MEKIKKKPIIISCSIIAFIAFICVFGLPICMSISYLTMPEPEIVQEVKKYLGEYNSSCEKGYRVRVTHGYDIDVVTHCGLEFEDAKINDADKIMEFFLRFHNEFGYENLCNSNEKSRFLNCEDEGVEFKFLKIEDEHSMELLYYYRDTNIPLDEDYDAEIAFNKSISFDTSIINEFKGKVLLHTYSPPTP